MSDCVKDIFRPSVAMAEIERVQYKLMLPAQLKAALEEAAHDHRRSLSAEIIQRLYKSLDMEEAETTADESPDEPQVLTSELFDQLFVRIKHIEDSLSEPKLMEVIQNSVDAALLSKHLARDGSAEKASAPAKGKGKPDING